MWKRGMRVASRQSSRNVVDDCQGLGAKVVLTVSAKEREFEVNEANEMIYI